MTLDDENKKEPVLNVRIVEEPVYGVTRGVKREDPYMSTYTQSQKIEVLLRWILNIMVLVLAVLGIIAFLLFMILDGFQVWTTVELR